MIEEDAYVWVLNIPVLAQCKWASNSNSNESWLVISVNEFLLATFL